MALGEHRILNLDGYRISYYQNGAGPAVLLIHGFPTHAYLWRDIVPALADRYWVLSIDLLGYGASELPTGAADLSLGGHARLLRRFLEQIVGGPAIVVGHEIGGGIAQAMAVQRPERVEALVLVDSVSYDSWPTPEARALLAELRRSVSPSVAQTALRSFFNRARVRPDALPGHVIEQFLQPWRGMLGTEMLRRHLEAFSAKETQELAPALKNLVLPTLILWGERDIYQKPQYARRLHEAIPGSRLELIEDGGHLVMEDRPERVSRLLREFLDQAMVLEAYQRGQLAAG